MASIYYEWDSLYDSYVLTKEGRNKYNNGERIAFWTLDEVQNFIKEQEAKHKMGG